MTEGNEMEFDFKEGGEDEKLEIVKETSQD